MPNPAGQAGELRLSCPLLSTAQTCTGACKEVFPPFGESCFDAFGESEACLELSLFMGLALNCALSSFAELFTRDKGFMRLVPCGDILDIFLIMVPVTERRLGFLASSLSFFFVGSSTSKSASSLSSVCAPPLFMFMVILSLAATSR